eukprot:5557599-Pyramimonas_sp.AAC.1
MKREAKIHKYEQRQDQIVEQIEALELEGKELQDSIDKEVEAINLARQQAASKLQSHQGLPSPDSLGVNLQAWTGVIGQLDNDLRQHLGQLYQSALVGISPGSADVYTAATNM